MATPFFMTFVTDHSCAKAGGGRGGVTPYAATLFRQNNSAMGGEGGGGKNSAK